jgi:hypothetical protein
MDAQPSSPAQSPIIRIAERIRLTSTNDGTTAL